MAAYDNVTLVPIAEIDQGERYRKTPTKNIEKLAASIDTLGLLHPVVVLPINGEGTYPLVVGQRRVLACAQLGFDEIEARIVHDMDEAERLLAELDENICREAMTPSEANACRKARAELLAPLAEERQQEGRKRGAHTPKGEKSSGKISQKTTPAESASREAAAGTGYSGKTLEKVEKMEAWMVDLGLPQEVRDFIKGKLDEINAAEKPKIHPAFVSVEARVRKARKEIEAHAEEVVEEAVPEEPPYYGQAKAITDARRAIVKSFEILGNAFVGADNFDPDVTPEEVDEFVKNLRSMVNAFAKAVKDVGA